MINIFFQPSARINFAKRRKKVLSDQKQIFLKKAIRVHIIFIKNKSIVKLAIVKNCS